MMRIDEKGVVHFESGGATSGAGQDPWSVINAGLGTGQMTMGGPMPNLTIDQYRELAGLNPNTPTGSNRDVPTGGPNSPSFPWALYSSLVRDPYMGGYNGWSPDFSSLLGDSLDPTGVQLDYNAIDAAIKNWEAANGPLVPPPTTTPVVPPPVEDTFTPADPWANLGLPSNISGQDILDYVGTGASDKDIAANMVMAGLNVDQVASVLGMDPDEAQRRFLGGLNEASTADSTGGLWNTAKSIPGSIANSVGGFFDNVFSAVKEAAPFWDQAQVVMGPNGATVVFGQQPSGSPYVPVTNLPQSNTQVGVTTGVPFLDQVINKAMGNPGGANSSTIKDAVIDLVKDQTGLPVDVINSVLKGEIDQAAAEATAVLAQAEAAKNAVTVSPDAGIDDEDEIGTTPTVPVEREPETPVVGDPPLVPEAGIEGPGGSETAPPALEELVPEFPVVSDPPLVPPSGTPGETGSEQVPPSEQVPDFPVVGDPPLVPEPGFEGPGGSEPAPGLPPTTPPVVPGEPPVDPVEPPPEVPVPVDPVNPPITDPVEPPPEVPAPVVPGEPPIETPTPPPVVVNPPITDPDGPPDETPTTPTTPDTGDLNGLLASLLAPQMGGAGLASVTTPDPSDINYIYDFESIFANPHQAAQFTSPTGVERVAESDLLEYLMQSIQSGQSIDDLLEELKR